MRWSLGATQCLKDVGHSNHTCIKASSALQLIPDPRDCDIFFFGPMARWNWVSVTVFFFDVEDMSNFAKTISNFGRPFLRFWRALCQRLASARLFRQQLLIALSVCAGCEFTSSNVRAMSVPGPGDISIYGNNMPYGNHVEFSAATAIFWHGLPKPMSMKVWKCRYFVKKTPGREQ
jgi:hypothetical protein